MSMYTRGAAGLSGLALLIVLVATAAAETTLERIKRQGMLRVGVAGEAPYGYRGADGRVTGEAPEIARIALVSIDPAVLLDGVVTEFGKLIEELEAGRFDVIAAGMFITPERCRKVAFSQPTYKVGEALVVRAGNPRGLSDFASVAADPDARLAVLAGAVEYSYAYDAGVFVDQVKLVPDYQEGLAELRDGTIDAIAMTALTGRHLVENDPELEAGPQFFPEVDGVPTAGYGAFAFRKEDEDLRRAFDAALAEYIGTERHWAAMQRFGLGPEMTPDRTTAELCADG